jgi:hypothetical protein
MPIAEGGNRVGDGHPADVADDVPHSVWASASSVNRGPSHVSQTVTIGASS